MLRGISGTLVSGAWAEQVAGGPACAQVDDSTVLAFGRWWAAVRGSCGPATSARALTDVALLPLARLLGYDASGSRAAAESLRTTVLDGGSARVLAIVTTWDARLDAAWRTAVRSSLANRTRWCLLFNGCRLRLLDASHTHARRHLDFDLDLVDADAAAVRVLVALLGPRAAAGPAPDPRVLALDDVIRDSDRHGVRVSAVLGDGVRRAIEHLMAAVLESRSTGREATPLEAVYEQALTGVYRAVFLCFAEARDLVPSWHPLYRDAYTMSSLADLAERRTGTEGLWEAFQAMSRLAHTGCVAGDLRVTAFNGRLFAPARAPLLEDVRLPGEYLRRAVVALSTAPGEHGRPPARIAYGDLGVEELGAVYERLLELAPRREPGARAPRGSVVLAPAGRAARKAAGAFYTPRSITESLVRDVLEPLVEGASADRILSLRVLDPAMGSGAFLVAACRYLADACEAARAREGAAPAGEIERAGIRRLVAQRCLFGVDMNPMAVHLARLSLWLTTLAADLPLTFLDHHLLAGDSLVGARPADVLRRVPGRRPRPRDERQLPLFDPSALQDTLRMVVPLRERLGQEPDATPAVVRDKERTLAALNESGSLSMWKTVCDLWCAGWFARQPPSAAVFRAVVEHVLRGSGPLPAGAADAVAATGRDLGRAQRFFHWPLELPEVFFDGLGRDLPDAGFDAVIGNPPWEVLRGGSGEANAGARRSVTRFTRDAGLYRAQSHGHANQYQMFVERAVDLLAPGGRLGVVVPAGLASDHGSAPLRELLIRQCALERIVGFDNRAGIFPIHRSVRFLLVTARKGGTTSNIRCRFGLRSPAELEALAEQAVTDPSGAWPVTLTPRVIERLSGPGLAIPDLRCALDLQIAEKAAALHPWLPSDRGWGARFARELNATDDKGHFTRRRGLPVIDGRHVRPFAVDTSRPSARIPREAATRILSGAAFDRPRLAFRDVAGAANRTTLIAAIVPGGVITTHTLFCLRTRLSAADQRVLCALLNSWVANFLVRLRVSTHVTLAIVQVLPVPRPANGSPLHARLLGAAGRLLASPDDPDARRDLQVAAAHAYALTPGELTHTLTAFPLVDAGERAEVEAAFSREWRR